MTNKQVILARPNTFIITDMKRLLTECAYEPTPVSSLNMLRNYNDNEIGGVVISTALNSTIEESYIETVKQVAAAYNYVPILLASLISLDKIIQPLKMNAKKAGLNFDFISVEDARKKGRIDVEKEIIVLERRDIAEEELFQETKKVINRYFR